MVSRLLRHFRKIAADQKEYRKRSSCAIICWIAKIYLSINNSVKWLATRISPMQLKKAAKVAQKNINNWAMVSFIHNVSEIITWMKYSFKTKSTESEATFLR